jgi:hypothetical protein
MENLNPEETSKKELKGFAKGVKAAQKVFKNSKEKVGSAGSMIKQSIIDHTIRYVIIGLIVVVGAYGTYHYVSSEVSETVTEIKQDVKDSIPHPIDATKKWFKEKKEKYFSNDENETLEITEKQEVPEVIEKEEVTQDKNETNWKDRLSKFKFWGNDKENNESEEK